MKLRLIAGLSLVVLLIGWSAAEEKEYSHSNYFEHYEGTGTCLQCHEKEAESFFHSQHYQWRGDSPQVINGGGKKLGKLNMINDFCTSPVGNWIGLVRNSKGEVLSRGCSACHAGLGKLPAEELSREQLENIDCLICHASGYRRDLFENNKGEFEWKPILWKNREGLDSISKRISLPTRSSCLRCHAASGGGMNYKRGDLEYKLADCDRDFDVHMASSGKNMQCVGCHAGEDHRVRGRGSDLAATDLPGKPLSCSSTECHGSSPHKAPVLNSHTSRVDCTVCHIPTFAREDATDMARDWSKPAYNAEAGKYTATIKLEKDVRPVYAWYNGFTKAQLPGEPVRRMADGSVGMMLPQGSRLDPSARIHAFKVHKARLPLLEGKNWIIPITVEQFFPNGKIEPAVKNAAREFYGIENPVFTWTDTTRYMGIFHGVQPATKALQCLECHSPQGLLDWKSLGYNGDPILSLREARRRR